MTVFNKIPPTALPKTAIDEIDWLQLTRSRRVGPASFIRLINQFGTAKNAVENLPQIAKEAGVKTYSVQNRYEVEREFDLGRKMGLTPLFLGTKPYPKLLAEANDAPPFLWAKGNVELGQKPCISIVGARNSSSVGLRLARNIACELGKIGYIIVSGLARGIDTAAHQSAMETGTIAVQAGGIDITYPKENADLQIQIGQMGLQLSETPLGLSPQARHFPQRNRIIAGLSQALVVVEAAARSGSMITARAAADLGRDVGAVPGSPLDPRAVGCNNLIRDGSALIRNAEDVHEMVQGGHVIPNKEQDELFELEEVEVDVNDINKRILASLSANALPEDAIIRDFNLPNRTISKQLTELEIKGKITRHPGGLLSLAG